MNDDRFRVEESAALLHVIFPSYPELHEINPAPRSDRSCPPCENKSKARPRKHQLRRPLDILLAERIGAPLLSFNDEESEISKAEASTTLGSRNRATLVRQNRSLLPQPAQL